jgi:hypothetical protein
LVLVPSAYIKYRHGSCTKHFWYVKVIIEAAVKITIVETVGYFLFKPL